MCILQGTALLRHTNASIVQSIAELRRFHDFLISVLKGSSKVRYQLD